MSDLFRDPMYVFPIDGRESPVHNGVNSSAETPGQSSITGVFAGPATRSLRPANSGRTSPGLYDTAVRERAAGRTPHADNVISVLTREGDELHYPVVHGRAGGSIHGQSSCGLELLTSKPAGRSDVADRAHRHASLISASASSHNATMAAGSTEEGTPEERAAAYQRSRATPSSIQQHRHSTSRGCSRSPPASVALRGEPVEDTVRATSSQLPSACSSLANTPRQSIRRTPGSLPLHELSSLDGGAAAAVDRRSHAVIDGVAVRVEGTGVSTPEMAEYYAETAGDAQLRQSSSWGGNPFGSSSSSAPSRRTFVTPRHSQQYGTSVLPPHPQVENTTNNDCGSGSGSVPSAAAVTGPRSNHLMLDRLMHLMEEQSRVSQQLLHRMDVLESTNKSLVDRLSRLESAVVSGAVSEEVAVRVSAADSASPSVTRMSGSVDSATRPSTRAPSKAIN